MSRSVGCVEWLTVDAHVKQKPMHDSRGSRIDTKSEKLRKVNHASAGRITYYYSLFSYSINCCSMILWVSHGGLCRLCVDDWVSALNALNALNALDCPGSNGQTNDWMNGGDL